jgi:hypothetical protein
MEKINTTPLMIELYGLKGQIIALKSFSSDPLMQTGLDEIEMKLSHAHFELEMLIKQMEKINETV